MRRSGKKEDAGARKGRKVAIHCVFLMICGPGGSKSRLAKAAGAKPAGQMRDEQLHAVVVRSTFRSQNVQSTPGSDHFWKFRCRKSVRLFLARSTFPSQKCKKVTGSDHFWKLRCRKSALHSTALRYTTLHYTQLHYATLHLQLQPQLQLGYFTLH